MPFSNLCLEISYLKKLSIILLVSFLMSCATKNNPVKELEDKATNEQAANYKSIANAKLIVNSVDPMANLNLPEALINSYHQIDGLNKNDSLNKDDADKHIETLVDLQKKYPKYSGPNYRLARIYYQQKKYDEALGFANQTLLINPNNYYGLNLKGLLHREIGEFDLAKQSYLTAISIYPNYPNSHLNLAILADIYLYDFELALNHYEYYMSLVNQTDDKVAGWIIDLKRRMSKMNKE